MYAATRYRMRILGIKRESTRFALCRELALEEAMDLW
jgi:hypothetical protein